MWVSHVSRMYHLLCFCPFETKKIGKNYRLPLYINAEHFARALPSLQRALMHLAPQFIKQHGTYFHPDLVLEVFPRILVCAGWEI
jgi:hypothetical protein